MLKTLIGLDIGTQTIKAVQLYRETTISLHGAGYIMTPSVALASVNPQDEQIVSVSINRLVHDLKVSTTDVSASLPSSKVITRIVQLPAMDEKDLASSIQWEAEQYIPWPLAKVKLDYVIIDRDSNTQKMNVLLVAAPLTLIEKYIRIITAAGLNPLALETEILASTRTIINNFPTVSNILVLSMGASSCEIGLIHNRILIYTKSIPIGGVTLSRSISHELAFEPAQAEEYLKTYGLEEDKLEGKIAKIITPLFAGIFSEMEKTVSYFKEKYPTEEIKTGVICGGLAKLPGLFLTITKNLGLDSQIANPFMNITVDKNILPILLPDAPLYSTAVGLALKEI